MLPLDLLLIGAFGLAGVYGEGTSNPMGANCSRSGRTGDESRVQSARWSCSLHEQEPLDIKSFSSPYFHPKKGWKFSHLHVHRQPQQQLLLLQLPYYNYHTTVTTTTRMTLSNSEEEEAGIGTSLHEDETKWRHMEQDDIENPREGESLHIHDETTKNSDTTETDRSGDLSSSSHRRSTTTHDTTLSETHDDDGIVASDVMTPESGMTSIASLCRCPLTHELFQDPVVSPDGETYERRAYLDLLHKEEEEEGTGTVLYRNRALQAIMEDDVLWRSDSFHGNWRRLQYKAQKAVAGYFFDPSSSLSSSSLAEDTPPDRHDVMAFPLSHGFYCPVTCNIMHDPVIDPDGNTFERVVVENWIRCHGTSPITRRNLTLSQLRPNRIIQRWLEEETKMPPESMRPEILKWIHEAAPKTSDVEYGGGTRMTVAEDPRQTHRGQQARRQVIYNICGILICILLLKILHYSVL